MIPLLASLPPSRLEHLMRLAKPVAHVTYEARERGPQLEGILGRFVKEHLGAALKA